MPRGMGLPALRVLQAIAAGVEYGFDICAVTGLASGTVYPALSRHERDGLVTSSWENPGRAHRDRRPPRRYYRLTSQGRQAIDHALGQLGVASRSARAARARG